MNFHPCQRGTHISVPDLGAQFCGSIEVSVKLKMPYDIYEHCPFSSDHSLMVSCKHILFVPSSQVLMTNVRRRTVTALLIMLVICSFQTSKFYKCNCVCLSYRYLYYPNMQIVTSYRPRPRNYFSIFARGKKKTRLFKLYLTTWQYAILDNGGKNN